VLPARPLPLGGAKTMILGSVDVGRNSVASSASAARWRQDHDFGFCRSEESRRIRSLPVDGAKALVWES